MGPPAWKFHGGFTFWCANSTENLWGIFMEDLGLKKSPCQSFMRDFRGGYAVRRAETLKIGEFRCISWGILLFRKLSPMKFHGGYFPRREIPHEIHLNYQIFKIFALRAANPPWKSPMKFWQGHFFKPKSPMKIPHEFSARFARRNANPPWNFHGGDIIFHLALGIIHKLGFFR